MQVFQYYSSTAGRNGFAYGFCFECPSADLDQLAADLSTSGILAVDKLKTVDDGKGGRLITGRERIIIGAAAVGTIQNPAYRHWEPAEDTAA